MEEAAAAPPPEGRDAGASGSLVYALHELAPGFEASVHSVPRAFRHDLAAVLPGVASPVARRGGDPGDGDGGAAAMLLVPTCQHAAMDLVNWGARVAAEKDALLERFAAWAAAVCDALAAAGWWADFIDPCSGLAVRMRGGAVYPEVDAFETLLKWRTSSAGGCKVLCHPRWGTAAYPATLLAAAPLPVLLAAMRAAAVDTLAVPA